MHVVVCDEDSYVAVLEFPDNLLDVLYGNGVYTCERLVQHNEFGFNGKTACYLSAATLSTRQAVSQVLAHLLQTELCN